MRFLALMIALLAVPAFAQITVRQGASSQQVQQFLNQMSGMIANGPMPGMTPAQQQKLQLGLAAGKVYGCTEQTVGKPALDAFKQKMEGIGRQVEALCKQGKAEEARQFALSNLRTESNGPVAVATRQCYGLHKAEILPLLPADQANDAGKYERWVDDPSLAASESTPHDVCKGSPQVQAAPAAPVVTQPLAPTPPTIQQPNQGTP